MTKIGPADPERRVVLGQGWRADTRPDVCSSGRSDQPGGQASQHVNQQQHLQPFGAAGKRVIEGAAAVHVFFESEISDIQTLAPGARFFVLPTGFDVPDARWRGGGGYLGWIGRIDPTHCAGIHLNMSPTTAAWTRP